MLLHKPKSTGIRRVAAAAALASFVIGVLAATAVRTSPGRLASTNLSTVTVSVRIEDAKTHKMCMTVQGDEGKKNAGLVLYERCTGTSAQVFEYDAKNGHDHFLPPNGPRRETTPEPRALPLFPGARLRHVSPG